ncbi:MAG TPA: IPT/TIG domain-containing protein, partial [Solirubrobacteraceae bacterium]|nr:IPT/TIG domain-containing protein [Solirubrobacteraceae bacterium]
MREADAPSADGGSKQTGVASPAARGRSSRPQGRALPLTAFALVGLATLVFGAAQASAIVVHVRGHTLSYQPTRKVALQREGQVQAQTRIRGGSGSPKSGPLEYHGGPVMSSNTNYAFYWDPAGAPEYPAGYETGIDRYFEDLAHDSGGPQNTDSILAQYYDKAGEHANYDSHFAGALIDTDPYPANGCSAAPEGDVCLTDEQLRTEIRKYVEANKLPTDLAHEYFMLTPPGVESCYEAAGHSCSDGTKHAVYCAYHSFITVGKAVIVYANDPYVAGIKPECDFGEEHPNASPSDATIAGGLAHEHSESVTDPEINAWLDSREEEVADKCRTFKATEYGEQLGETTGTIGEKPGKVKYNEIINTRLYLYQQMWSNEAGECMQRVAVPPTVKKIAPKSGSTAGGTSVTITGTHFTSTSTVKF